jgi:hypothetical protein
MGQRVIPEKSEALNFYSLKKRYVRFFLRSYNSSTISTCDFDSEVDFAECEDFRNFPSRFMKQEEKSEEDDEDEDDIATSNLIKHPNFTANTSLYFTGPNGEPTIPGI